MRRIPAFTVLLLMAVAAFTGVATLPLLNIQYTPSVSGNTITVSTYWQNASERAMETEVISRIEGVLSGMRDVSDISSVSAKGSGSVTLAFRKGKDMAAARFEVASAIRNLYGSFPDGVAYPSVSINTQGSGSRTVLTYIFRSPLPSSAIENFVSDYVTPSLSAADGVEKVTLWGATPYELEVVFDSGSAASSGITASMIASAFDNWFSEDVLGFAETGLGTMSVSLGCLCSDDIGDMPVTNVSGRIVYLRDIASWSYRESSPTSYFRMNGLNTVMLSIDAASQTSMLETVSSVKDRMAMLQDAFPEEITASISYDASEHVSAELEKIYWRTALCILILLAFVYVVSRSWRYLFVVAATLAVNILSAITLYNIFGLPVHIYTLAGITVSLGMIIDSSIVMADHYSYYRNRSVFPALLGATATTIGALCVILLLPDKDKANLEDFAKVIMINLGLSLVTAYLFVPSLIDRFPTRRSEYSLSMKRLRRVVRWNRFYSVYIERGLRHRWAYIAALVVAFGIPLFLIPNEVADKWKPYAENRGTIDRIAGSTFAMFSEALDRSDFYREPGRDLLCVHAGMPEGCSVGQLNEVVAHMENWLSQFDEIEMFSTRIDSYDNALIQIFIRPEYENTYFPSQLKSEVIAMAANFGGATWRVWGVNDSYFNNNVISNYKSHRINLRGYDYDALAGYADSLISYLKANKRVSAPEIMVGWTGIAGTEYYLSYDFAKTAAMRVSPYAYYDRLSSMLYDTRLSPADIGGRSVPVVLRSSQTDSFDLWHVLNSQVYVDSTAVKLSEIGSIEKRRASLPIYRHNQSYEMTIGFDFVGSYELASRFTEKAVAHFNSEVLPVGYKSELPDTGWLQPENRMRYAVLILIVIAIIYAMCSMTFESFRLPLAVILLIPVSFIGVFLIFGCTDFVFDQGGFAAFVMLSGIVVNAGIYLLNSMANDCSGCGGIKKYIRAFNHKINPIMLTVISTVLGLVPFLFDGPDEVFWFDFAIGTISGLIFSLIALYIYLPVFAINRKELKLISNKLK